MWRLPQNSKSFLRDRSVSIATPGRPHGCTDWGIQKILQNLTYQQLILDKGSRPYVVVNKQKGLFKYFHLPLGVSSTLALFQQAMDTILQRLSHIICYLDNILITGATHEEHLMNLVEVLSRLSDHRLRLKQKKCSFMKDSIEYLSHHIDTTGIHTSTSKVEAISRAPAPKNLSELCSFLGMVNYYKKFILNLAGKLHSLYSLLKNGTKWNWSVDCVQVFDEIKTLLVQAPALVHYNPKLPLRIAGDASSYGIGGVLSHGTRTSHCFYIMYFIS